MMPGKQSELEFPMSQLNLIARRNNSLLNTMKKNKLTNYQFLLSPSLQIRLKMYRLHHEHIASTVAEVFFQPSRRHI